MHKFFAINVPEITPEGMINAIVANYEFKLSVKFFKRTSGNHHRIVMDHHKVVCRPFCNHDTNVNKMVVLFANKFGM